MTRFTCGPETVVSSSLLVNPGLLLTSDDERARGTGVAVFVDGGARVVARVIKRHVLHKHYTFNVFNQLI